jgi:hypothetical protein
MKNRALGLAAALTCVGCYSTSNVARLAPLETGYPVSASRAYVSVDGTIVTPSEYRVVDSFSFERQVVGLRHSDADTVLHIEPDLDRIVRRAHGDAVTRLKVDVIDYDPGSHEISARLKSTGWLLTLSGACALSLGAAMAANPQNARIGLATGGAFAALGLSTVLLGSLLSSPSRWRLWFTGYVVQHNEPGAPSRDGKD